MIGDDLAKLFDDRERGAPFRWAALARSYPIERVRVTEDHLTITFANGARLVLTDEGQSCCEHRYMSCDDDLPSLAGGYLDAVELAEGPDIEGGCDCHETMFLKVRTSKGDFTVVTHNEHNGYYGGFDITPHWEENADDNRDR